LERLTPTVVARNPSAARDLVRDLEGLPLAIQVAGRLLEAEATRGFGVDELLKDLKAGTALLKAKAPVDRTDLENEVTPTVATLLAKSTDVLGRVLRQRFAHLGAFAPKPATFRAVHAAKIWNVRDPGPMLRKLADRGLVERTGPDRFQIHAVLVMHARSLLTA
jgi:hypothetical protein